jgi:hypothetical protein
VEREGQAPQRITDGCTLHAGEPFTAICRQCGTYMCKRCNEDGRFDKCARCRAEATEPVVQRVAKSASASFPFRRDGVEWGAFLRFCFARYTQNFGLVTLTTIAWLGSMFALNMIGALFTLVLPSFELSKLLWPALSLVQVVLFALLTLGVLKISLRVVLGQPAELSLLWSSVPRLGAFFLVSAATVVALFGVELVLVAIFGLGLFSLDSSDWTLGTLIMGALLAAAGIAVSAYVSLGLVLASLEIVAQPDVSVLDALKNAWRIARGERMTLGFGLFLIGLLNLAGMIMCGVGMIFTLGLGTLIFAALYLALRNGAALDTSSHSPLDTASPLDPRR